ncbi:MAG: ABC transporter permease [Chloroflexi bacterium]|nr:MAG: ABC transporter permease [Chloroflexota bacterium]MBL1194410.1 ABC transporter permease [Chloroflexota bacterium]
MVALFLFQFLLLALIYNVPYNFAALFVRGSPARRAYLETFYGLDRPLWEQYLQWMGSFLRGDLGVSFQNRSSTVVEMLGGNAARSMLLFFAAAIIAYLLGIWLGKTIAWHRGGLFEAGITLGGVAGYTAFAPWLGFVAINVFGWYLGWLPYNKIVDPNVWYQSPVRIDWVLGKLVISSIVLALMFWAANYLTRNIRNRLIRFGLRTASLVVVLGVVGTWWTEEGVAVYAVDVLRHLVLPLGTVVMLSFGETMMLMRTAMLETMQEDYVLTARAKGLPEDVIRDRHIARNALFPVFTRMLLNLPFVLLGSLVIEQVFDWQGIGMILFNAIQFQDLPIMMGFLSIVGIVTLSAHIFLDVLYVYLDPRLRLTNAV